MIDEQRAEYSGERDRCKKLNVLLVLLLCVSGSCAREAGAVYRKAVGEIADDL